MAGESRMTTTSRLSAFWCFLGVHSGVVLSVSGARCGVCGRSLLQEEEEQE